MLSAMIDFLAIAITFPALPFTLAVVGSTAFWLVSIVSGLDLGADGAADGVVDGALDGALDGAGDALDGVVDGAGEAAGAAADGPADAGDAPEVEGMAVVASVLGLGRVPITVWLSLFSLWAWVVAFLGGWLLRSPLGVFVPVWPGNLAVLVLAGTVGVVLARVSSRPLEPLYRRHGGRDRASLVGEEAEITTSRVDARFGQARVEVGSDDLVVQVRCDRANPLARGHRALIVQFDATRDAFVVEPLDAAAVATRARTRDSAARQPTGERTTH